MESPCASRPVLRTLSLPTPSLAFQMWAGGTQAACKERTSPCPVVYRTFRP